MAKKEAETVENQGNASEITRKDETSGGYYEIRVRGQLSSSWSEWLGGLEVRVSEEGDTLLCGQLVDQAALMGVLNKLSHLNLNLLAINRIPKEKNEPNTDR